MYLNEAEIRFFLAGHDPNMVDKFIRHEFGNPPAANIGDMINNLFYEYKENYKPSSTFEIEETTFSNLTLGDLVNFNYDGEERVGYFFDYIESFYGFNRSISHIKIYDLERSGPRCFKTEKIGDIFRLIEKEE